MQIVQDLWDIMYIYYEIMFISEIKRSTQCTRSLFICYANETKLLGHHVYQFMKRLYTLYRILVHTMQIGQDFWDLCMYIYEKMLIKKNTHNIQIRQDFWDIM